MVLLMLLRSDETISKRNRRSRRTKECAPSLFRKKERWCFWD